jgi:hypothetical protein
MCSLEFQRAHPRNPQSVPRPCLESFRPRCREVGSQRPNAVRITRELRRHHTLAFCSSLSCLFLPFVQCTPVSSSPTIASCRWTCPMAVICPTATRQSALPPPPRAPPYFPPCRSRARKSQQFPSFSKRCLTVWTPPLGTSITRRWRNWVRAASRTVFLWRMLMCFAHVYVFLCIYAYMRMRMSMFHAVNSASLPRVTSVSILPLLNFSFAAVCTHARNHTLMPLRSLALQTQVNRCRHIRLLPPH